MRSIAHELNPDEIIFRSAGNTDNDLIVGVAQWVCGDIEDGVSVRHGYRSCGYVVALADLEKIVELAKAYRYKSIHAKRRRKI